MQIAVIPEGATKTPAETKIILESLAIPTDIDFAVFIMGGALHQQAGEQLSQRVQSEFQILFSSLMEQQSGHLLVGDGGTESGVMALCNAAVGDVKDKGNLYYLGVAPADAISMAEGFETPEQLKDRNIISVIQEEPQPLATNMTR